MASLRHILCWVTSACLPLAPIASLAQSGQAGAHDRGVEGNKRTLPLVFEANQGQFPAQIGFVGKTERYSVAVEAHDLRFSLPGKHGAAEVVLSLQGSGAAAPAGIAEAPFLTNYFVGSDPAGYRTGIRNYTRIGLRHVYPGIDAEFYANGSTIEHDFLLAPGAQADRIALRIATRGMPTGGTAVALTPAGDLAIAGGEGELRLKRPVAYQLDGGGRRTPVAAAFAVSGGRGEQEVHFKLGSYDHSRQLVIDPVIEYGSFFDGLAGSTATALAADAAGNVYLTGHTASAAPSFGVAKTNLDVPLSVDAATNSLRSSAAAVFVAKFNPAGSASPVAWLSYFGDNAHASASTSLALQPMDHPAFLAVGGSTLATDLPTTPGAVLAKVVSPARRGFVATFATADGSLAASTYLDSASGAQAGTTEVNAVAMDGNGNVFAVGSATGSGLLTTGNALAVDSSVLTSAARKGFLVELTPALGAGPLTSYLSGDGVADTSLTSLALDPGGNLYVGGYTAGSFPMAGTYSAGNMYLHNPNDGGGNDAFAAKLVPGATGLTIQYSAWFSGSGDERLNALALDRSGNLFVFGQTASPDLTVNATSASAAGGSLRQPAAAMAAANPATAAFPAKLGRAATSGFAAKLNPAGQPLVTTFLGGSGEDVVTSGGVDAAGRVFVAGHSSSPQAMSYAKAALLPPEQDLTGGSQQHGFLLQLPNDLSAVKSIANIGGAAGPDTVVGLALDSSKHAYVGGNISSASAFTSKTAFQASRNPAASSSAYLARITALDTIPDLPITLAAVSCPSVTGAMNQPVGCPDPIGFPNASGATAPQENVTYTYTLMQTGTDPVVAPLAAVVLQIPAQMYLSYDNVTLTDNTPGAASQDLSALCVNAATGVTCTIPTYPETATQFFDSLTLVLGTHLTSQPPATDASATPPVPPLGVTATVSAAAYNSQTVTDHSNVVLPAQLSITTAVSSPANATVFTTNSGATSPNTQVGYTFTINNAAGAGNTSNAAFSIDAGGGSAALQISGVTTTSSSGTCTASGCTGLTIPAGGSVNVVVTGTYADAALGGAKTATAQTVTGTATSFLSTAVATTPAVTVQRGVHLVITSKVSAPPNGQTNFNLGDTVTLAVSVTNNGPSTSSGSDTVTVTLPAGFTPALPTGAFTCTGTTCTATLMAIAAGSSNSADGTSGQPLAISGTFQDNSTNAGIVAAAVAETFSVTGTLNNDFESATAGGDYMSSATANVTRTASLAVSTATLTPPASVCAPGSSTCVYMQNAGDILDQVGYSFTVDNAGPNISVGTQVTITLPFAPANPAGTAHPVYEFTIASNATAPGFGGTVVCSYNGKAANTITCNAGNLPVGKGVLTVTGTLEVDNGTVPTTATAVTTANSPGSVVVAQSANGTPGTTTLPAIQIDRAAHLIANKTATPSVSGASAPVNLDENAPSVANGTNDAVTVKTTVGSAALNAAPNVVLTDTLPLYFRITQVPAATPAAVTCTVGGVAIPSNYTTGGTPVTMTCNLGTVAPGTGTPSSGMTAASLGATQATVTYTGKFIDSGTGADITGAGAASKVSQLSASVGTVNLALSNAVDPYSSANDASSSASINVQRLVHMFVRKTRNVVNAAPATYTFTYPNLDSEPGKASFGANDEIEYEVAFANGGVNKAVGVQFSDTLPPYFTLENLYLVNGASTAPDTGGVPGNQMANSLVCFAGNSVNGTALALPFATGAGSQPITCTYGTVTTPQALGNGTSTAAALDNATAKELVYQGKFQDNAVNGATVPDNIPAGVNTFSVTSNAGDASVLASAAVDNGTAADRASVALPAYLIQRAAHLTLVTPAAPLTDTGGNALTKAADNSSIAAQAEPSSVPGATPVFNCFRYKTYIQNSGPNAARQPQLTVSLPSGLNLASTPVGTTGTPNADAALASSCSYGASAPTTVQGAALVPLSEATGSTPSLVIDLDGYFGLNTLVGVNALAAQAPSYTALADSGIADSVKGSTFAAVKGQPLTVVNTPFGSNFTFAPYSDAVTRPVALTFAAVGTPGITSLMVKTTTAAALPTGKSPVPNSSATPIPLYKAGATSPQFYSLGTTAAAVSGNTGLCVTSPTAGAALPDGFAKPERVLLWGLANLPGGTMLGSVPNVSSTPVGDITSSVAALGLAAYVQPGGPLSPYDSKHVDPVTKLPILPAKQSQPQMVCGRVNSFPSSAAMGVFAVLEPVNFSPVIVPNTNSPSQTPGKGVSEVSFLFPTSFDPNNNDPCYVATASGGPASRSTCDDNLVLTTRIFGGEDLVPSQTHIVGPLSPDLTTTFVAQTFEVQAGATLYDLVTDQLAEVIYLGANCDPGVPSTGYAQSPPCTGTFSQYNVSGLALSGTPKQAADFGSGVIAQLFPSLNGGSSALIILPTLSQQGQANYVPASGTVTAGQSVGFLWRLRLDTSATTGTYNLTCNRVDATTHTTVLPFPAGLSCQIPSTITLPADIPAYIVTQGNLYGTNTSGWKTIGGTVLATLLLPLLLFRRRLSYPKQVMLLALLFLGGAVGLAGCGSGTSGSGTGAVASGTYWFSISATPAGGTGTITSTAFSVTVVGGN